MQSDGVRSGYDLHQLKQVRSLCQVPLIASGGAGSLDDFIQVFLESRVDGALAASIFHDKILTIHEIKLALKKQKIEVRL